MNRMDWNLIKLFLAVADTGSLTAASLRLGMSQPTVGRGIDSLEKGIGVKLFKRGKSGMQLTETGLSLLEEARKVAEHAYRVELQATGKSAELNGPVRITASDVVSTHILPDILAEFGEAEPQIEIELVVSNDIQNLLSRDADIAIRMTRPTQLDVVASHVNTLHMGTYAHQNYLEKRGFPQKVSDLFDHDLVGYDRATLIIDVMKSLNIPGDRHDFRFRTDDQVAYWELVKAGAGIGFGPNFVAAKNSGMVRILSGLEIPPLEMWLAYHVELKNNVRIRRAIDFIGDKMRNVDLS